jgi:hypothetical protein
VHGIVPYLPRYIIYEDLLESGSADATLENIFQGLLGPEPIAQEHSFTVSIHRVILKILEDILSLEEFQHQLLCVIDVLKEVFLWHTLNCQSTLESDLVVAHAQSCVLFCNTDPRVTKNLKAASGTLVVYMGVFYRLRGIQGVARACAQLAEQLLEQDSQPSLDYALLLALKLPYKFIEFDIYDYDLTVLTWALYGLFSPKDEFEYFVSKKAEVECIKEFLQNQLAFGPNYSIKVFLAIIGTIDDGVYMPDVKDLLKDEINPEIKDILIFHRKESQSLLVAFSLHLGV